MPPATALALSAPAARGSKRLTGLRRAPTSEAQLAAMREQVRAGCTDRPGVYRMIAEDGEIVYVGKSKRVRTRLLSYFRAAWPEEKGARILRDAVAIEWDYTPSEFAALLLELRLIKRYRPRFNVAMKRDARHYAFVKVTRGPAAKLAVVRGAGSEDGGVYYGPYQGATRVGEALRELNDALGLRDCAQQTRIVFADQRELFVLKPRTPGCIRHEIQKCLGPCVAACTAAEYDDRVRLAMQFLDGSYDGPMQELRARMLEASAELQFERAGVLRDKLQRLEALRDQLARLRFAVETLSFLYAVPGHAGEDVVYFIRRGRVRAERPAAEVAADPAGTAALIAEIYAGAETDGGARVPAHEIDELLLLSSWFRRFPAELERATRADAWAA